MSANAGHGGGSAGGAVQPRVARFFPQPDDWEREHGLNPDAPRGLNKVTITR